MSEAAFDSLAQALEERTALSRIEARGTMRLAMKEAGVDSARFTVEQVEAVMRKVMPGELAARGIDNGQEIGESIAAEARLHVGDATGGDSPEDIFSRLGG
ncbi:MAG: hypothetical protein ACI8W3_003037 [Myxococcota bacterium]|jgi:hypothetical protein